MISAGSSIDAAIAALKEVGEGARLVRARIPRPTYYIVSAEEDPAEIPLLKSRKRTRAEVCAVMGADATIRPDSMRETPVVIR